MSKNSRHKHQPQQDKTLPSSVRTAAVCASRGSGCLATHGAAVEMSIKTTHNPLSSETEEGQRMSDWRASFAHQYPSHIHFLSKILILYSHSFLKYLTLRLETTPSNYFLNIIFHS